jgi:serine/threonine protein kinase
MAQASTTRRSQTDFEQLRFLGSGAFGEVHMCRNRIDGQLYALKVVKIRVDDARRDKVLREARLLSSLTPHGRAASRCNVDTLSVLYVHVRRVKSVELFCGFALAHSRPSATRGGWLTKLPKLAARSLKQCYETVKHSRPSQVHQFWIFNVLFVISSSTYGSTWDG